MKIKKQDRVESVNRSYRVECNCGSKYFADESAAITYFDYMSARGFEAELWIVGLFCDIYGAVIKGSQRLLAIKTPDGITEF